MKSIGIKLFFGYIIMTAVTISLLWLIQAGVMRHSYLNEKLGSVDRAIDQAILRNRDDYDQLSEEMHASLIVMSPDGQLIYRSQGLPMMGMMVRSAKSMIPQNIDGDPQFVGSAAQGDRYGIIGKKLSDQNILFAVFSLVDVDEAERLLRQQLWIITLILIFVSIVLAIFLSRRLSRPIRAVTTAADHLAKGDYSISLPVVSGDETGQLTQALNNLSIELQKSDQLQKELIANVSHELRAPLSVIKGYAETVRDVTWPYPEKRQQQLTLITQEADRLTAIVKDILDYSRLQAGVLRLNQTRVAICPLLEEITQHYDQLSVEKTTPIKPTCQPEGMRIIFDPERLKQVLHNLIQNALNHADPETPINLTAIQENGRCRITIENHGETIPPDQLNQIWKRYYRSPVSGNRVYGTGLGLAIVQSIFDRHQISYGVESRDQITRFWFDCPTA